MLLEYKSPQATSFTYPNMEYVKQIIYSDPRLALQIRTMSLPELVEVRTNWLIPEGWPGIKFTLAATYASDPQGFYLLEKSGLPIASISVVNYPAIKHAY